MRGLVSGGIKWAKDRSVKQWIPHTYQEKAVAFLTENGAAALFADPGTGKTSTTLAAFCALQDAGVAKKLLVIAPRRVCQLVWWQESRQWAQFCHLRFAWLHDSRAPWDSDNAPLRKKDKEIDADADVYVINPEGVPWLYSRFYSHKAKSAAIPFDTVCVDELTRFKTYTAKRSKMLRKLTDKTPRIWGLTGSPTPNGYEDLFGQMLLLDGGASLGWSYTMFRDKYFEAADYMGYKYQLRPGAAERIEAAISPMVLRISAEDWLTLPKQIDDPIKIRLDISAREAYSALKKDMLLHVEGQTVTAANSAALYSKLSQLANGAVYVEAAGKREVVHVHDAKLEALDDLVESLAGAPLLLAYEFNHDLDRLKAWYAARNKGKTLRFLGQGVKDAEVLAIERDWNANAIDVLAVHPASAGHGLNFQKGAAQHVCWFSATWDFELYDQLIQRVLRQGNTAPHVVNHLLLVEDTIDELKYAALTDKDQTQERFLQAINTAFNGVPTLAAGLAAISQTETGTMAFEKLKHRAAASAASTPEPAAAPASPKGWGKATPAAQPQAQAIRTKLTEAPADDLDEPVNAAAAFSPAVRAALSGQEDAEEAAEEAPTPKRARAKKAGAEEPAAVPEQAFDKVQRRLAFKVEVVYNDNGVPVPRVSADAYINGDFDAAAVDDLVATAVKAIKDAIENIDSE